MAPSDGPQRLATLEMGTLSTSVNEGLVFQHAGPGQVQTNQAQDKEAEGERQVRRLVVEGLHEHGRVAVLLPLPQAQNLRPGIIAGSGGQGPAEMPGAG